MRDLIRRTRVGPQQCRKTGKLPSQGESQVVKPIMGYESNTNLGFLGGHVAQIQVKTAVGAEKAYNNRTSYQKNNHTVMYQVVVGMSS